MSDKRVLRPGDPDHPGEQVKRAGEPKRPRQKVKVATYIVELTLYDDVEEGQDPSKAPDGLDVNAAIEKGIDDWFGFEAKARVNRTDE